MRSTTTRTLVLLLALTLLPAPPATAQSPALELAPAGGPAGTSVRITGCGWTGSGNVVLSFDGAAWGPDDVTPVGGCIDATRSVPGDAAAGDHRVTARQAGPPGAGALGADATFTVTDPSPSPPPPSEPPPPEPTTPPPSDPSTPTLALAPSDAEAGDDVTATGCGWEAGTTVELVWAEAGTAIGQSIADASGCLHTSLELPADVDGDGFGTVRGTAPSGQAVARLRVTDQDRLRAALALRGEDHLADLHGTVSIDDPAGVLVRGSFRQVLGEETTPEDIARAHIEANAGYYGITEAEEELVLVRASELLGRTTLVFEQRHAGVDVFGAHLLVSVSEDGAVTFAEGRLLPPPRPHDVPEPLVSAADAVLLSQQEALGEVELTSGPRLVWFDEDLYGLDDDGAQPTRLAWFLAYDHTPNQYTSVTDITIVIDGLTGEALRVDYWIEGLDRLVYDSHGMEEYECLYDGDVEPTLIHVDGTTVAPATVESARAANALERTVKWFRDILGQDGHAGDGDGEEVLSLDVVHYDERNTTTTTDDVVSTNASYSAGCDEMRFSTGTATSDIITHEFTHGVTAQDGFSNLVYQGESGALNESFSDVFAVLVDCGFTAAPCEDDDWLIGEGSAFGGPLRDVREPALLGDPDTYLGDGWQSTASGAPDDGGVHSNSGVVNKVASLLLLGGVHGGIRVGPIDRVRFARLWHAVNSDLPPGASMAAAAERSIDIVQGWAAVGVLGYTDEDLCSVRNAWAAVQVLPRTAADVDCDGEVGAEEANADGDSLSDALDPCPDLAGWHGGDTDADGIGDACDDDVDGDGTRNLLDTCPVHPNPAQADGDGDGIGDACEDTDLDGIGDLEDTCPTLHNTDQVDTDGDHRGDACDTDDDADGHADAQDNCALVSNQDQANSDGGALGLADPLGDACDNCPASFNPDQADLDHDGDGDVCDGDDDGDGVADDDDNCPTVENPTQDDLNDDGIGQACDDAEPRLENAAPLELTIPTSGTVLPLGGCSSCPPSIFDGALERVVQVSAPVEGVRARVVDGLGRVVASAYGTAAEQSLTFEPPALAYGGTRSAFAQGDPAPLATSDDLATYTLQLLPPRDAAGPVEVVVTVRDEPVEGSTPQRVAGPDRFSTAAAVSATAFAPGVPVAYLATGEAFPDALAGGPAAALAGGPVLLTRRTSLPDATAAELQRLAPSSVVVLGGTGAVADGVVAAVEAIIEGPVTRVAGPDRFATAAAVSADAFPDGADVAYVATGGAFPDALAGGPAAAAERGPVLLVNHSSVPEATRRELARLAPAEVVVLGGTGAVADAVVGELEQLADRVVRRSGADRHATAAAISAATFPPGTATAYVATSAGFADALAGGAAAGVAGAPILLVPPGGVPDVVAEEIDRLRPQRVVVLGGTAAVTDQVLDELAALIR